MNVFFLDNNPKQCAAEHCDKHVVKMILEYAQLLSTAHRLLDGIEYTELTKTGYRRRRWMLKDPRENHLYKSTHMNHPSAVWVRESSENYMWLYTMWVELMKEYTNRYGKVHASSRLNKYLKNPPSNIPDDKPFAHPPQCMPDHCKVEGDTIQAYKNYYITEKRNFATWKNETPEWYK